MRHNAAKGIQMGKFVVDRGFSNGGCPDFGIEHSCHLNSSLQLYDCTVLIYGVVRYRTNVIRLC